METTPHRAIRSIPLQQAGILDRYGVQVVAVRKATGAWHFVTPQTVLEADDTVLVAGPAASVERFDRL